MCVVLMLYLFLTVYQYVRRYAIFLRARNMELSLTRRHVTHVSVKRLHQI